MGQTSILSQVLPHTASSPVVGAGGGTGTGTTSAEHMIIMGRIGAPFGVHGWLHVQSFTSPEENLFKYAPLFIKQNQKWVQINIETSRPHGDEWVVKFEQCSDRNESALLTNLTLAVPRSVLPPLGPDEYYWFELIGLTVTTLSGETLGVVDSLFETKANDVLVVKGKTREHLIPYLLGDYVTEVDLNTKQMRVCWDPEF